MRLTLKKVIIVLREAIEFLPVDNKTKTKQNRRKKGRNRARKEGRKAGGRKRERSSLSFDFWNPFLKIKTLLYKQ